MSAPYISKEHLGGFSVMKTAGQTSNGPSLLSQINIPIMDGPTDDPDNNVYPGLANGAAGSMVVIKGGRTPVCMVTTVAHSSWFLSTYLNDWLGGNSSYLDTYYDTSAYSINQYEPVTGSRIYDVCKCQSIVITYNAQGGGIMVQMAWPAIYGPGELAGAGGASPTFTTYAAAHGQAYNRGDVVVTGFDQDRSFVLTLVRAQGRQFHAPTTGGGDPLNAVAMTSHAIGGSLAIEQSKTFGSTPSSSATIQIGPATTGAKFVCQLNRDRVQYTFPGNAPGSTIRAYSLADINAVNTGVNAGYPVVISAGT